MRRGPASAAVVEIVRFAAVAPSPWRNGGGVTFELWREPAADAPFRRRLSVAHVARSGPFSDFTGYRRRLTLLDGAGMELDFGGGECAVLHSSGDEVAFDGGHAVEGRLRDGPTHDLNWFESAGLPATPVSVRRGARTHRVAAQSGTRMLVFCGAGTWRIHVGTATHPLAAWDLAVLGEALDARVEPVDAVGSGLVPWIWLAEPTALDDTR